MQAEDTSKARLHLGKPISSVNQLCWLMGTDKVFKALVAGDFNATQTIARYQQSLTDFKEQRKKYLLY